ncbi:MAG: capsid protein [Pelagibacterium sp. SCN 63-23]|nr:MAG: capsid protein [Pelagibacterium sp. SCN 63-23]
MTNPHLETIAARVEDLTGSISTRLSELEKSFARMPANDNAYEPAGGNTLANAVRDNRDIQSLTSNFRGKAVVKLTGENAAITSGTGTVGSNTSSGTSLVPAHRIDGIVTPYERALTIRDVIGSARTTSNVIEFPREDGFDNQAKPVAEGAPKPYSDLTFELESAPVRTIAHLFKISRQMLDDGPALADYIGRRGTYGLKLVEENQILAGNGAGQNIHGIIPQATAFVPQFSGAKDTAFDRVNQAISQAEDAEVPVNAVVMNRRDWRAMLGLKDGDDRYIADQSPFGLQAQRLWNLPVVATNAMPAGTFLVGAFQDGATIFDRLDVEVLISTENDRDFERNLATVRVESRLALAVFRPGAFVTGDLLPSAS